MTFKNAFKEQPPKVRKRAPVTAAELKRILSNKVRWGPARRQTRLWLSSIYYTNPTDFVLDYWNPKPYKQNWESHFRTSYGNLIHSDIQHMLHAQGALFPQYEGNYEEVRIECPTYRISGKIDGLIPKEYVKALGATKEVELPDASESELLHLEIKTTSSNIYKNIQTASDISEAYRTQATVTQNIINKPGTLFLFVDTGSLALKTIWYEGEDHIWERTKDLSRTIFSAIDTETLPLPAGKTEEDVLDGLTFKQWLAKHRQERKEWEGWWE